MPNITISLDENLMRAIKQHALKYHTSLDNSIQQLLQRTVKLTNSHWLEECFHLMDQANANSHGTEWRREDLYNG